MASLKGLFTNKMSSPAIKLLLSAPKALLLSIAVFILLSGGQATEPNKCYWCGPLAEQVHRSQRAPPCDTVQKHVTDCDPGYPYCAIVATASPLVESRYCVKLYQDECYSLFCNSTKIWRMICPCRGDLCNGPNNDREKEAFNALLKITDTTNDVRTKRAMIFSSNFISNGNNDVNNMIPENRNNRIPERDNYLINTTENITEVIPSAQDIAEVPKEIMSTEQANIDRNNTNDKITEPNNESKETAKEIEMNSSVETTVEIRPLSEMVSKTKYVELSSEATTTAMKEMHAETSTVINIITTMEKIPTAGALQQNKSPVEKTKELMATETTLTTVGHVSITTVMPTSSKNNTGTVLQNQLPALITGIIMNQYL